MDVADLIVQQKLKGDSGPISVWFCVMSPDNSVFHQHVKRPWSYSRGPRPLDTKRYLKRIHAFSELSPWVALLPFVSVTR